MTPPIVTALVSGDPSRSIGPSHYVRIYQPLQALAQYHGFDCRFVYLQGDMGDASLRRVMRESDVIMSWRSGFASASEAKAFVTALHSQGKKWVCDADDHINQFTPGALATLRGADLITVTTEPLRIELSQYNKNVVVLPNSVDVDLWPKEHVDHDPPIVVLMGGPSHDKDWRILADVWPRVHARYPEVELRVIGPCPKFLNRPDLHINPIGWHNREEMPALLAACDIGLAPLGITVLNRAKSNLHWLEYAMAGVAGIYSPMVYGESVDSGSTGLIARGVDEWVDWISLLIREPAVRRAIVRNARREVERDYDSRVTSEKWATAYRRILNV